MIKKMDLSYLVKPGNAPLLEAMPGDPSAKFEFLEPILQSLHRNRLVLHSRFTALIEVPNLTFDRKGMQGDVQQSWIIHIPGYIYDPTVVHKQLERWHVSCDWKDIYLHWTEDGILMICAPYYGWTIWPESQLVSHVNALVERGDILAATRLLNSD